MNSLASLGWPLEKLGVAIQVLARRSGLLLQLDRKSSSAAQQDFRELADCSAEALGQWIESVTLGLGLEVEQVETPYARTDQLLRNAGPALLYVNVEGESRLLAVLGSRRNVLRILSPELAVRRIRTKHVRAALCQHLEASVAAETDRVLDEARVSAHRRRRARAAILQERLASARIGGCWLFRPSPGGTFWHQMRFAGLRRRFLQVVGAYIALYVLWALSWWLIGRGALEGRTEGGWLVAWTLLLLTLVPIRLTATWGQNLVAIGLGALLKQRLLYASLKLDPDDIRNQGAGQLLGRVFESESLENLALSGGFLALFASTELIVAVAILLFGAGGGLIMLLLVGWTGVVLLIVRKYFKLRSHWTDARLSMTHDVIERMVGHRTRLAQEPPERWHVEEDQALDHYLLASRAMDRTGAALLALAPRGWLVVGLLGVTPSFVAGRSSPAELAIAIGGIIFAFRALQKLVAGLSQLAGASIAWEKVAPFFHGAARTESEGSPTFTLARSSDAKAPDDGRLLLDARNVVFRYRTRREPVMRECSVQVCAGDRILLEGPSGGGKSTFGALLAGLRLPDSGVVLLEGLDHRTTGSQAWRRRVVLAPQFQENHVLTETFAFNLLMGRGWPAQPEDFEEAEDICRELGLSKLLDRMPAGLVQMVGESGWQLSHGERSRLYIGRALLQKADLVVLDESLAALDPDSFRRAMQCVLRRASTLILIAHT
jgi:ATP-binding cassette subfamily B protein